jgi:hypothetical protein
MVDIGRNIELANGGYREVDWIWLVMIGYQNLLIWY